MRKRVVTNNLVILYTHIKNGRLVLTMLSRIRPAYDWWRGTTRIWHCKRIYLAVCVEICFNSISGFFGVDLSVQQHHLRVGLGAWPADHKHVEVKTQLQNGKRPIWWHCIQFILLSIPDRCWPHTCTLPARTVQWAPFPAAQSTSNSGRSSNRNQRRLQKWVKAWIRLLYIRLDESIKQKKCTIDAYLPKHSCTKCYVYLKIQYPTGRGEIMNHKKIIHIFTYAADSVSIRTCSPALSAPGCTFLCRVASPDAVVGTVAGVIRESGMVMIRVK